MYRKSHLLATFILLVFFSQTGSASSDEALALADRLLEQESYDEAITEYKRFIFFNPKSERVDYALYKMGLAHRSERNWQAAINAFGDSISVTEDLRTIDERRIILATTLIASGNYSLARLELLKVSEYSQHPSLRLRSLYFDGVASLYMFDWDSAEKAFGAFYKAQRELRPPESEQSYGRMAERTREMEAILLKARQSYKSPGLGKFLSTILPGMGQIYAGNWRSGLNALVLNGITIGLFADSIYKKDFKDAALISSISIRYYMGNRYNAEKGVGKYNESQDRQNAAKMLNLVREDEPR